MKGFPGYAIDEQCRHDFYKAIYENNLQGRVTVKYIRSLNHRLFIMLVDKAGFNTLDIKRVYPFPNNLCNSLPFGHYLLRTMYN